MLKIKIMADVAVKVAISRITRISLSLAPNLFSGLTIPSEGGRGEAGRENGVARPWITEHQTVGIHGKPTELSLLQIVFESGKVGAFWKPNAARLTAKGLLVFVAGDQDLGADSLWMLLHQRQKSMCGRAGDDLQNTVVLESSKRSDEIALQTVGVDLAAFEKTAMIHPAQVIDLRVGLRAIKLPFHEPDRPIEIA